MPQRRILPSEQKRFGTHVSVAGGMHLAYERAAEAGCDCFQVFVKNQRQWNAKPFSEEDLRLWRQAQAQYNIGPVIAHNTYLINLAATDDALWQKSIDAFTDELNRCEQLGIAGLVAHPGSHCGAGEEWGITRIAQALDEVLTRTKGYRVNILLEVTAGQGSSIGYRFEHLAAIMGRTRQNDRLAVCLDTCHLFAAGYDLASADGYDGTITQLDHILGIQRVQSIHVNDSKKPLGSRVDRHDHIGQGLMSLASFRNLINDKRLFGIPFNLETPKGSDMRGRDWDRLNLATLRKLVALPR